MSYYWRNYESKDERLRMTLSSKDYDDYKETEKNHAERVAKRRQWVQDKYEHLKQDTNKSCLREKLKKMYMDEFDKSCFVVPPTKEILRVF